MTQVTVKLQIAFESLLEAIVNLPFKEKHQLWQVLDKEINQFKADLLAEDPYDWGLEGQPQGKPVEYIPGVGLTVVGGKDAST
ncbi:hypothetical protein H6G81_29345 [Scytonema hofmannii FACHB-248]|uniref:Uncharacterized protein n=1 Tax=Scytonema hofmannii FACHB-248 TaxID=1842502 RepID=A0ABR8GZJ7_9CYAN|nr:MULTISPECIES: hypothetical protein [Nostocales]MBD2608517.1 hypothetical protein [Scytonema hofmannii FACHB-248]